MTSVATATSLACILEGAVALNSNLADAIILCRKQRGRAPRDVATLLLAIQSHVDSYIKLSKIGIAALPEKPPAPQDVVQFVQDYRAQSNVGTAWPYAYVVQQDATRYCPDGEGDTVWLRSRDGEPLRIQDVPDGIDTDTLERLGETRTEREDVQWFFTKSEAEKYIERDGHNLKNPGLYVKHFRRDTEAEMILRTMFTLAGESYGESRK